MEASQDIRTKTGGAYIPPAKLRLMQQSITDKEGEAYQRLSWEALKKSINGLINKVNISNIELMVRELFQINLIRGRGLFCRAIMRAQMSSPTFTHVYAALVAVCNSKFPTVGALLVKRLITQFRQSYQRNDKEKCINTSRFLAHLVNQSMVQELLALEILILLLENSTNDSVEVAIAFLKECGAKLEDVARRAVAMIFETLRNLLHDAELNKRVQYMIEVMFAIRKDKFKDHPSVPKELDLVEEGDQITHTLELSEEYDLEERLNVFKLDDKYQENESRYEQIKNDILGGGSDESGSGSSGSESDDENEDSDEEEEGEGGDPGPTGTTDSNVIIDQTETNLIALRKTIYLTIQSSLDFEECAHKLLKLEIQPAQIPELCNMIVDCCAQQRTYIKFYGLLAQRFCQLNFEYIKPFEDIFKNCYDTIHRFETCKLRNVAKLFAHLLHSDAIPWTVLAHIKLNEYDTTSSSRVFIKYLFQELAGSLGLVKLNGRIKDATLQEAFDGLFPRDEPQNTRFAINFFTSIGLGGLTDDLREHLKTAATKQATVGIESLTKQVKKEEITSESSSSDSSDSSDSSSDSSSSSDEDSDTEDSSDDDSDHSRSKPKGASSRSRYSQSVRKHRSSRRSVERNENEDRLRTKSSKRHSRDRRESRSPIREKSDRKDKDRRHKDTRYEASTSSKRPEREEISRKRSNRSFDRDFEEKEPRSKHRTRDRSGSPDYRREDERHRRHLKERNQPEPVPNGSQASKRASDKDDHLEDKYKRPRIQSQIHRAPSSEDERRNRDRSVSPENRDKRRRH